MPNLEPDQAAAGGHTATLSDPDIVSRILAGDAALFEVLMRRHNRQVYRAARAVVRDEQEAEDVMQQAYLSAFRNLHQFGERSRFSTWLTRIALNEAFGRRRKQRARSEVEAPSDLEHPGAPIDMTSPEPNPERQAYAHELQRVLEDAVDALPETYRTVFMLREVEGLSTSETGESLDLGEEAVKTRLHRARAMIRSAVTARLGEVTPSAFEFHALRCDRVVAYVMARLDSV